MILYHYTAGGYLRPIGRWGLTVGDVPTDIRKGRGLVGVWLTTSPSPDGHGLEGAGVSKKDFRLEVTLPDDALLLHRWLPWAERHVTGETRESLHATAAQHGAGGPASWYVYLGVIAPSCITNCVSLQTGEVVDDWSDCWPIEFDLEGVPPHRRQAWQKRMLKDVRRAAARAARAGLG